MITIEWLKQRFCRFNDLYFSGSLPEPQFRLTNTKSMLGTYRQEKVYHPILKPHIRHIISISLYFQRTPNEYENTLLHEMIHYYINYHKIKDTSTHGEVFRSIMEQLNREHGWDLSISTKVNHKLSKANRGKLYVVLSMKLTDTTHLIAVVNRKNMVKLNSEANRNPLILEHHWYLSTDPYFDQFPVVRTLKGYHITEEQWTKVQALTKLVK